ncbi:hypothetical protein EAI_03146 [Harpegnathos saltator]|uniref:Uncharacterized protein n=1 Tax=Harpegnathos saltator TaxID=610380 RepID=E2BSF0_HARSA|nr:hypothetical protein EAI_03146 [Harpegnathos saltator]
MSQTKDIRKAGAPSSDLDFDFEVKGPGHFEAKLIFKNRNSYFRLRKWKVRKISRPNSFTASCSNTLLGMLFACGHFKSDQRLYEIAIDIVEARRLFGENELDIGNHVCDMFLTSTEEVEETLRNDAAYSSSSASNCITCEEMYDIEEASAEEVQHSRPHAKPFDIRFLLENYHVVRVILNS